MADIEEEEEEEEHFKIDPPQVPIRQKAQTGSRAVQHTAI
jgi:hypothetical protein